MPDPDLPLTYAAYFRVSTQEQTERQTIVNQQQAADAWCKLRDITLTTVYLEDGVSGSIPVEKRPEGARMLADARAGRFKVLLIYRIDRLARSTLELLRCVETLDAAGVALQSMSEPFETGTPLGRVFVTILASIAQLERDSILERTRAGKRRNIPKGNWPGGPVPYGYRLENSRLVEEPSEAVIIREMFRLILEGESARSITRLLNARGLPSSATSRNTRYARSGRWNMSSVLVMLRNPAYYGEALPERGPCPCPVLVTREDWSAVQQLLKEKRTTPARSERRVFLLRGFIRCRCGYAWSGAGAILKGKEYLYYRCGSFVHPREDRPRCTERSARADHLEAAVWMDLLQVIEMPDLFREAFARQSGAGVGPPSQVELAETECLLESKREGRMRLIRMMRQGAITEAEATAELAELRGEVETLERRLETLRGKMPGTAPPGADAWDAAVRYWRARITAGELPPAERRAMVEAFVFSVDVPEPHQVRVAYRMGELKIVRDCQF